jgi:3-oxoadipate enol-lactonase
MNATASALKLSIDGPSRGTAVVLANSLASTRDMWASQVAAWSLRQRIVRYDYAGHGGTPDAGAPDSVDGMAQQLLGALDALGIERFRFVGLSLGGMLGLRLAASAPARVERLVVANARWYQTDATRAPWAERIATVRAKGTAAIAQPTLERWFTAEFRASAPEQVAAVEAMIVATSPEGYAAAATAVRDFDARPWLATVRCPTLVVSGAQDAAAPAEHLQELAQALQARHLALSPCGHLSNIERADEFSTQVGAFLR